MHLKAFLPFFLLLFSLSSLIAQKKKKDSDVEIIEFGDEKASGNRSSEPTLGYVIKTSPTSYLFGSQFVEAEKYVTDFLSLQAGLGLTFKPLVGDLYGEALAELDEDGGSYCDSDQWASDICDEYYDFSIRKFKPGLLLSTSLRLFFDDDAMDGGYFAVKLRYSIQNLEIQDIVQNSTSLERLDDQYVSESVKRFDLVGHYGYQTLYSRLSAEYFIGLGARFRKEDRQDVGINQSGIVQSTSRQFKASGIRIEGGIRIGFQL